ncbi:hypothetical protein Tco_0493869 [Tanacetum coccineum]
MHIVAGDGVAGIKRCRRDLSSDSDKNFVTTSGPGRLKEDLESSTWRQHAYDESIGDLDMMEDKVDNPSHQSTPQVLPSFEVYTPLVTYPKEVEETLGTPMEPQPQPLPNYASLDASLGNERGPEPPIKPPSLGSFRMKEVDHLIIHTPPSPHVASFHLKDTYYYYHPCIDDPKKHYGFKSCLLGQSGFLGVDFSNMEMIEDDWELEPKEVSFLGRRLNLPVIFDEKKLGSS